MNYFDLCKPYSIKIWHVDELSLLGLATIINTAWLQQELLDTWAVEKLMKSQTSASHMIA